MKLDVGEVAGVAELLWPTDRVADRVVKVVAGESVHPSHA